MSHQSHSLHMLHKLWEWIEELEPLDKEKNEWIAFLMGGLFGGIGLGLYFWSWKDFFLSVVIIVFIVILLLPTLVGESFALPVGFFLTGVYGARRAFTSNENLR